MIRRRLLYVQARDNLQVEQRVEVEDKDIKCILLGYRIEKATVDGQRVEGYDIKWIHK